jgi:hypothetical protein
MSSCWSVVFVDGPGTRDALPSGAGAGASLGAGSLGVPVSAAGCTLSVAMRSTGCPGCSVPPTARSSGTVMLTARRSGIDGSNSSPGRRIEKMAPASVDASRFGVRSWPALTGTLTTRPSTWSMLVNAISLIGSTGTLRITTSASSIALRPGISAAATTTWRISTSPWLVRPLACRAMYTVAATSNATMTPTAM